MCGETYSLQIQDETPGQSIFPKRLRIISYSKGQIHQIHTSYCLNSESVSLQLFGAVTSSPVICCLWRRRRPQVREGSVRVLFNSLNSFNQSSKLESVTLRTLYPDPEFDIFCGMVYVKIYFTFAYIYIPLCEFQSC
jgi:hypothetical protein